MFNVHQNLTADGELIYPGMKVVTNECEQGTVVADEKDSEFGCCAPTDSHTDHAERDDYHPAQLHDSGQTRIGSVWYTDHEDGTRCPESAGGIAPCMHDHWFRIATKGGTKSFNGERLGARSYGGVKVA